MRVVYFSEGFLICMVPSRIIPTGQATRFEGYLQCKLTPVTGLSSQPNLHKGLSPLRRTVTKKFEVYIKPLTSE